MRKNYLVFGAPYIGEEEINEVVATLKSGWIGTGPKTAQFEEDFARYIGVSHAVALASCTAALHLSILALDLNPGDEIITTPMTFCATSNAILHSGAIPVFADVTEGTWNLDPDEVRKKITGKTKAIVPVHFYGRPCEMEQLLTLCSEHNLKLIGDCAHAIETEYRGTKVGALGDVNCFSFYPTKNLVTGEGGMITTNSEEVASKIKRLALHGLTKDAWKRFSDQGYQHYQVVEPGFKYNMTDMQSSLGVHQLKRVEKNYLRRQKVWQQYQEAFKDLPVDCPLDEDLQNRHALHLYTLNLHLNDISLTRDEFLQKMHEQNIGTGVHYLAVHLQPYYQKTFGYKRGDFPVTEKISDSTVSLPLSAKLTDDDVRDVILAVRLLLSGR